MLEFTIPSMTCGHCVSVVKQSIEQVDAQAQVEIDLPSHRVRVQTQADRQAVAAALAQAGYEPAAAAP
jgi:copper chaperone